MSRASESRRQRRALRQAGVALLDRVVIDSGALAAAVTKGADVVDLVALHVATALERLHAQGGDVLGHTVVTIGAHPDFPGGVTIEVKVASKRAGYVRPPLEDGDDASDGGIVAEP
jgi:hypothetical protein